MCEYHSSIAAGYVNNVHHVHWFEYDDRPCSSFTRNWPMISVEMIIKWLVASLLAKTLTWSHDERWGKNWEGPSELKSDEASENLKTIVRPMFPALSCEWRCETSSGRRNEGLVNIHQLQVRWLRFWNVVKYLSDVQCTCVARGGEHSFWLPESSTC